MAVACTVPGRSLPCRVLMFRQTVAVACTWSQFALQSVNVQADRVAVAGTWSQFALQC